MRRKARFRKTNQLIHKNEPTTNVSSMIQASIGLCRSINHWQNQLATHHEPKNEQLYTCYPRALGIAADGVISPH